jgi:cytoskeleton protein RodZ
MSHFGVELKRERQQRGVTLESISESTKISSRHLQALEEEQFGSLPGGVLNKGFVRGYARTVGLDEDHWVTRYMEAYRESGLLKDDDANWIEFAENVGRARKGDLASPLPTLRWAGVALLLTLLALFTFYVAHFVSDRASAPSLSGANTSYTSGLPDGPKL